MSELFLKIINMSISASWLVLAVLILRLVLKKAPKWVNVLLWGIVAVRLAFPFSVESALSLLPSAQTVPLNIEMAAQPAIDSGIPVINRVVNPVLSSFAPPQDVLSSANPLQIWIPILVMIWIIGVAVLLLYTAVSYWCLRRKVDTAVRYKDNIFQSENVSSPFVLGIIKPRIYLPFNMDSQDLEHVVAHEQAHIRRKDHLWKPLGFLLLTIHWFNPLMWLAYILLCRDIEFACDEKVIKELGNEQRADYTQALVACSINRHMIAACPLAFGEVGVKERVKSVMNYKKPAFWIIILAVIACVVVAVCFLTDPLGFRFDEASHTIVSANHFDMRTADDAVAVEMNSSQISELSSRLAGVKNTKKSDEYGGFTPGYQISALLEDGTYIRISGYSLSDKDMVDIEWNGERYVVSDSNFQDYLSRICAGEDVSSVSHIGGFDPPKEVEIKPAQDHQQNMPSDNIREITDPTDDPNFAYNTAIEKIYEDERNEYFVGGLYSRHIIVYYADGTQEDIVTALNAGRVTIADLDKFGIRYWAEPKTDPLDTAISSAILAHYAGDEPDGLIHVESHVLLANEAMSGTPLLGADDHAEKVTAYLLVYHVKYSVYGGALEAAGGSYVPTAITFKVTESGKYDLEEYWEPRDGVDYANDIRKKFPGTAAEDALDAQAYTDKLEEEAYGKALAYLSSIGGAARRSGN